MDNKSIWERVKLKPCPFCGGDAAINYEHTRLPEDSRPTHAFIMCKWCGCGTDKYIINRFHDADESTYSAIKAWNRRINEE